MSNPFTTPLKTSLNLTDFIVIRERDTNRQHSHEIYERHITVKDFIAEIERLQTQQALPATWSPHD